MTGVAISSDPGDDDTYSLGEVIRVKVTFSEAVDVDATDGAPRLEIDMGPADWDRKWATYESGAGTAELVFFTRAVEEPNYSIWGIAVLEHRLDLNGGAIRSTATQTDAHLWYQGIAHDPNHKVDGIAPSLWSASATGARLTLTYDEALDEDSVPPGSAFTVNVGGSEVSLSHDNPVTIAGVTVTLTLASAVAEDDTVTASYAKPTAVTESKLRDIVGNEASSFADEAAGPDNTPPRLMRSEIDGAVVTQFYSKTLDTNSVPAANAFRVYLARKWGLISPVEVTVHDNTVALTLDKRATMGELVQTRYIRPTDSTAMKLRDLVGNEVKDTVIQYVDNLTGLPSLEGAMAVRDRLTLTFSGALDEDSVPAASAFTVKVSGSAVSLANEDPVSVSGSAVSLTLAAAVSAGDTLTVSYAKPSTNPLRNAVGEVRDFTDVSVMAALAVTDVAISSTPAAGDTYGDGETIRVTLTFSECGGRGHFGRQAAPQDQDGPQTTGRSGRTTPAAAARRCWSSPTRWKRPTSPPRASPCSPTPWNSTAGGSGRRRPQTVAADLSHKNLEPDSDHKVDWRQ